MNSQRLRFIIVPFWFIVAMPEVLTSPGFASDVLRLLLLYYVTRALENFYVKKQSHKNVSFVLSKPTLDSNAVFGVKISRSVK